MSEDKKWSENEISSEDKVSPPCSPVEIKVEKGRGAVEQPRNLGQALIRTMFYGPFSLEYIGTMMNFLPVFFGESLPDDIYDDYFFLQDTINQLPKLEQEVKDAYKQIFDMFPHSRKITIRHDADKLKDNMKVKKIELHQKMSAFIHKQLKKRGMSEEDFARIFGFGGKT